MLSAINSSKESRMGSGMLTAIHGSKEKDFLESTRQIKPNELP